MTTCSHASRIQLHELYRQLPVLIVSYIGWMCVFVFVGGCLRGSYQRAWGNSVSRERQAPPCHWRKRARDERTERQNEHSAQWISGTAGCEACPRYGDQCIQETAGGRGAQVQYICAHTHIHTHGPWMNTTCLTAFLCSIKMPETILYLLVAEQFNHQLWGACVFTLFLE